MDFIWKNIGIENDAAERLVSPSPVNKPTEGESRPQAVTETRLLDGRPVMPVGRMGEFYSGPVGNPISGSICSPINITSAQTAPRGDSGTQVWGWDPNKREEEIVIQKSPTDVATAFLVDERQGREERPTCTAFNGAVNSAEKTSFNTSYDSEVFSSYDSEVNSDDNAVVE